MSKSYLDDYIMPVLKKMGKRLHPLNTENNYSNMAKKYGKKYKGDLTKNRSKVGKNFR